MNLMEQLLSANLGLVEDDFATYYSDLYVVNKPGVLEWLKENYAFPMNIQHFTSQVGSNWNGAGRHCLDIPFANTEYWEKKGMLG